MQELTPSINESFAVPSEVTFEQAMKLTRDLLAQIHTDNVDPCSLEAAIARLVSTKIGARGFFVTYLTDDSPINSPVKDGGNQGNVDEPHVIILNALRQPSEIVADLLVKNLIMSSAMAIAHQQRSDETMAASSKRVRSRTMLLIARLQLPHLQDLLNELQISLHGEEGLYQAFLERQKYDSQQRQAIQTAVEECRDLISTTQA